MARPLPRPIFVPLIIALNVVVFWLWQSSDQNWMAANFLVSWDGLLEGRWWTLLTSVFSHNMFLHIFINMYVLYSFGGLLEQILGRWRFLSFYVIAGIVSSLAHAVVSAFIVHQPEMPALGASGAVVGLVLVFALIFPREKILLLGIIPLPALWGAILAIGLDLWGLVAQARGGGLPIGHGAHLGGAFTGIVYYFLVLRPKLRHPANRGFSA